jgi:hypothetical protein
MKTCRQCGAACSGAPRFCSACGHRLRRIPRALVVLSVPAFLVLLSLAFNHPKQAAPTPRIAEAASAPPAPATCAPRTPATSAPKAPAASTPKWDWNYRDWEDGMGRKHWIATVASANTLEFGFPYRGAQHATLAVRSSRKDVLEDVYITIERGQFLCGFDDCSLNVKFDDRPIRRFRAAEASDHSTTILFVSDAAGFIDQLRKAKRVRVEARFYQEGMRTADFRTEGFEW